MAEVIKKLNSSIQDQNVEDVIDNLIEQVEHKENVLIKENGKTQEVNIGGTILVFVNGQFKGVK